MTDKWNGTEGIEVREKPKEKDVGLASYRFTEKGLQTVMDLIRGLSVADGNFRLDISMVEEV